MKRLIAMALLATTVLTFASCGTFVCDECEEEKRGEAVYVKVSGTVVPMCNDCAERYWSLMEWAPDRN